MNETSRYNYEKQLREVREKLSEANDKLYWYETAVKEIYDGLVNNIANGSAGICRGWLLGRIKKCLK